MVLVTIAPQEQVSNMISLAQLEQPQLQLEEPLQRLVLMELLALISEKVLMQVI